MSIVDRGLHTQSPLASSGKGGQCEQTKGKRTFTAGQHSGTILVEKESHSVGGSGQWSDKFLNYAQSD